MSALNVKPTDRKLALNVEGFKGLKNEQGNTMLPVLGIFLAVSLVFQSTELTRIAETHAANANTRIRDSRNSLHFQLNRYLSMPAAFRNSLAAAENKDLQNCLLGNGGSPCYADGREYPMKVYGPALAGMTGVALSGPAGVAGTKPAPILYNTKGKICETEGTEATVQCPFEVTTVFKAKCAGGASSCAMAESVAVEFSIHTPETLYNEIAKNRLVLASRENSAMELKVKDILPPTFDYIPNAITTVHFVTNTTESTVPATSTTTLTYEAAYQAILTAIGGTNTTLATTIANSLYNYYKLRNLSVIEGLTSIWLQNAAIAKRMADSIQYRIAAYPNYVPPTPQQIAQIAAVPLSMTNQMQAVALSAGLYTDQTKSLAVAAAISGVTNYQAAQILVSAGNTNQAVASAVNTAIVATGLTDNGSYVFGEWATYNKITDPTLLTTYANVLKQSGASYEVAWQILKQGITDITVAKQMVAAATTTKTPTTTTASTTTAPTTTTTTVTTTTTKTTAVSLTAACTSSLDCGTTIGM